MVLVADDGGARVAEDPVEEEEVVAEHDHQPAGDQHQVQGPLLQLHPPLLPLFLCSSLARYGLSLVSRISMLFLCVLERT
uniref:Uncharacterized protein n=1 Tax=Arundo donax TaxID=35708 RepID=A0A0A9EM43_ARUDO